MTRLYASTVALLFVALSTTGCDGCDGGGVAVLAPDFRLAESLEFGAVLLGTRSTQTLVLDNRGNGRGTVRIDDPGEAFVRLSPRDVTVAAGAQVDVVIEAAPTSAGAFVADLVITAEDDERRVRMRGDAIAAPDCDDDNACTEEVFDLESLACIYTQRIGACDDGNACSENDRCLVGVCIGDRFQCDDGIDCTIDGCDVDVGCVVAVDDSLCDDGDACTQDICGTAGCSALPLPEGGRCGAGVECLVAEVCLSGACTTVPLFDGAPCDDGNTCTLQSHCDTGQCVQTDENPLSRRITSERTFLSPHKIEDRQAHQVAYARGRMFVVENERLSVFSVTPDGYAVTNRLPFGREVKAVVRVNLTTLVVSVTTLSDNVLLILDVLDPDNPTVVRTIPVPSSPWSFVPDRVNGVGFCAYGSPEQNWMYLAQPRVDAPPVVGHLVECETLLNQHQFVGVDGAVVSTSLFGSDVAYHAFSFNGDEVLPWTTPEGIGAVESSGGYLVQGQVVFFWQTGPDFIMDAIDPLTLERTEFLVPPDVESVAGVFRGDLYVTTTGGGLARFDIETWEVEDETDPVVVDGEIADVVGDSPDGPLLLLVSTAFQSHRTSLRAYGVTQGVEITTPWRNGFSTSVEDFFVGDDESLTVVGLEAVTRGDVLSLRSVPVHPLARRALASPTFTIVYDELQFAGAFASVSSSLAGPCTECRRRFHWNAFARLVFLTPTLASEQNVPLEGTEDHERSRGFNAVSVRGRHAAAWTESSQSLSLFDLVPDVPTGHPQKVASFQPVVGEPNVFVDPILVLHENDRVSVGFGETVLLVDMAAPAPFELARDSLPNRGLTFGGHSYFSAWSSSEQWLVLLSGGVRQFGIAARAPVLRLTSLLEAQQVDVNLPADDPPTRSSYRAHILGVVDGLAYIGHTRTTQADPVHEILIYNLDDLAAGPVDIVTMQSEVIGMELLADGGLLVGREDGFTFLNQQCTEAP